MPYNLFLGLGDLLKKKNSFLSLCVMALCNKSALLDVLGPPKHFLSFASHWCLSAELQL
jgi:hypothetical protein